MTELARREETLDVNNAVAELATWAESARAAHDVAVQLCQTSFVPAAFRDKPYEATAAILSGLEVGLSPMAALRSFDIISGSAAPRAATLRAIVQSRGHRIWVHEATATRAIVRGQRLGEFDATPQESRWDMDRARQLGLAGKPNWKSQPTAMLIARATSECCRLIASDAILGIAYSVEELTDGEVETSVVLEPKAAKKRTARRAPVAPAVAPDEPDLDEPAPRTDTGASGPPDSPEAPVSPPSPPSPDDDGPITPKQLTKLHINLTEYGIGSKEHKEAALAYYEDTIGHPVASSKDLSKVEASKVIDRLERELRPEPGFDEEVS